MGFRSLKRALRESGGGPGGDGEVGGLFDFEEAVVFGEAFGLADGADFDLVAGPADGEVGEPVVFGFAAAGAEGDFPVRGLGEFEGFGGFGEGADLVDL